MRKKFIIDGRNFSTMQGFYDEIEKVFTFNLNWKIGRSLDAFNDILRGGFGRHDYGETILIEWQHFEKSKQNIGNEAINLIEEIILDKDNSGHDCVLKKL